MKTVDITKEGMRIVLCMLLLTYFGSIHSQERKIGKADKEYENLAFIDAAKVYESVASSGYRSIELFKKLGNVYYFNADYTRSNKWYTELFSMTEELPSIYFLRYAQSLKATESSEQASIYFKKYMALVNQSKGTSTDAEMYMPLIKENSGRYQMHPLSVNTEGIDFGAGFLNDKTLVFASSRDLGILKKRISPWDGLSFLDLYQAEIQQDGSLSDPKKLRGEINTSFHESSAVFSKDGKTVYFTRNNTTPLEKRQKNQYQHLKIYRAHLVKNKWTNIEDLSINGDTFSTAHPALSPDGSKLYFASNRQDAIGLTDIFVVTIHSDGSLGRAENLGEKINTPGKESFPFVSANNELYFSSEGHFGYGGYDVFYVKLNRDGSHGNVLNVGSPINSVYDDLAYVIKGNKGYVSSNRGKKYDNIYSFVETKKIKDYLASTIHGIVTDGATGEPIEGASVVVLDEDNVEVAKFLTNEKGRYQGTLEYMKSYILKATSPGYTGDDGYSEKFVKIREHNFQLDQDEHMVKKGLDLAEILNIKIYFALDRHNIRPDAEVELEKLVVVLKEYPTIKIDIKSHTDSRANDGYNKILSDKRANSTMKYLIAKGIAKDRLTAYGYGESKLVNDCGNGVKCSEVEHQQNRRSEFIIVTH